MDDGVAIRVSAVHPQPWASDEKYLAPLRDMQGLIRYEEARRIILGDFIGTISRTQVQYIHPARFGDPKKTRKTTRAPTSAANNCK